MFDRASHLRRCVFTPYRKGMGPVFTLDTFDTGRRDSRGSTYQRYVLRMREASGPSVVLFEGDDYSPSPMNASDSDAAIEGIMGFLCLRPGDTDSDYFEKYTPEQLAFAEQHAEALSCCVSDRFCDESGRVINR